MNQEVARVLNQPEVRDKLFASGLESVGGTPEQLATTLKSEMTRMGQLIQSAGLRAN